jgi:tetratricopeptide (TPR) repeat protein
MKSAEDMLVAEEYIDKGGNYRQAIDIYKSALSVDPENAELQQALAAAEANRYMSEERFAAATKGMTKEQVREVLGIPYHANVRTFPDDNVEAWFYPVNAAGSAAAVWFRQSGGEMKAYEVNFEEVVKEGPSVVGEEPEST